MDDDKYDEEVSLMDSDTSQHDSISFALYKKQSAWWCHDMEKLSSSMAFYEENLRDTLRGM